MRLGNYYDTTSITNAVYPNHDYTSWFRRLDQINDLDRSLN